MYQIYYYVHIFKPKKYDYFVVDGFMPLVVGKSRVKVSFVVFVVAHQKFDAITLLFA